MQTDSKQPEVSCSSTPWSLPTRIAFRFAFAYVLVFYLSFSAFFAPLSLPFALLSGAVWGALVPFVATTILGVESPPMVSDGDGLRAYLPAMDELVSFDDAEDSR